jgi:hypothetical protein
MERGISAQNECGSEHRAPLPAFSDPTGFETLESTSPRTRPHRRFRCLHHDHPTAIPVKPIAPQVAGSGDVRRKSSQAIALETVEEAAAVVVIDKVKDAVPVPAV